MDNVQVSFNYKTKLERNQIDKKNMWGEICGLVEALRMNNQLTINVIFTFYNLQLLETIIHFVCLKLIHTLTTSIIQTYNITVLHIKIEYIIFRTKLNVDNKMIEKILNINDALSAEG